MTLPADLICPFCGEMRAITATEDELFWHCDTCAKTWGQDRPAPNENDLKLLHRLGIAPGGKDKPWAQ